MDTSFVAYILSDETVHPNNKLNDFVVRLPKYYHFNQDYEVAVVRVDIPNQIYNIREDKFFSIWEYSHVGEVHGYKLAQIHIPPGYYNSHLELKNALQLSFDNYNTGAECVVKGKRRKHGAGEDDRVSNKHRRVVRSDDTINRIKRVVARNIRVKDLNPFDILKSVDDIFKQYYISPKEEGKELQQKYPQYNCGSFHSFGCTL